MKRRVVVTGIGLRTPLGDLSSFFSNLVSGRSGIRRHPELDLGHEVGYVEFQADDHFSKLEQNLMDRVSQIAVVAAQEAVNAAGLSVPLGESAGVYIGTAAGGETTREEAYGRHRDQLKARISIPAIMTNAASSQMAIHFGIQGECQTYSTACASSSIALGEAFRRIRDGYIDVALAGGSDCVLRPGVLANWKAMGVLCREDASAAGSGCRPFSKDRTGFAIGEGAAIFVLESLEHAQARGAQPICEFAGYGMSSDAAHLTKPDAQGQAQAMLRALREGGISAQDIGHVNAHATGTLIGDAVEARALEMVLGQHLRHIPVSATKSAHGHLMGASGAIEFAATAFALKEQTVPPTTHWREPDPACALDCVPGQGRSVTGLRYALSNSFAFGGSNVSLLAKVFQG